MPHTILFQISRERYTVSEHLLKQKNVFKWMKSRQTGLHSNWGPRIRYNRTEIPLTVEYFVMRHKSNYGHPYVLLHILNTYLLFLNNIWGMGF